MTQQPIKLSKRQKEKLEALVDSEKTGVRVRKRAQILLLSALDWSRPSISEAIRSSIATIGRVRSRFIEEGLESALYERPRPGAASKLSLEEEQRLVALACTDAPEGFARWSLRLLQDEGHKRGLIPRVSHERIRIALHHHGLKPWREKNVVYP